MIDVGLNRLLASLRDNRKALHLAKKENLLWAVPPLLIPLSNSPYFIEVVGSKWKTSTAYALAEYISLSRKVGLFTSPHLLSVSERIQFWEGGRSTEIPLSELYRVLKKVVKLYSDNRIDLSYFEALFFSALLWFDEMDCDFVVLEAGLGGRFDATNAVEHQFVVLTRLELEHTDVLGDSLEAIASEKLAVIGDSTQRVFVYNQFGEDFYRPYLGRRPVEFLEVDGPLELARCVAEAILGIRFRHLRIVVPGRMEEISLPSGRLVLDVAHTPDSVSFVLNSLSGSGWSLFLSLARDKDIEGICRSIVNAGQNNRIKRIIYVEQGEERFLSGQEFYLRSNLSLPLYLINYRDLKEYLFGFEKVLVMGSHSLVGEAKRCLH